MAKFAKIIDPKDNVMTALADIASGEEVTLRSEGKKIFYECRQDVPFGHKIAILDIAQGEKVVKYGEAIGCATQAIKKGDWVHIHNVKDEYKVLDRHGNPLPGQGE